MTKNKIDRTTISIKHSTKELLKKCKLHPRESDDETILKLIQEAKDHAH